MNIVTKTINNLRYAKYRKLRDMAFLEMKKHEKDVDSTEWKYWTLVGLDSMQKCIEIPLH